MFTEKIKASLTLDKSKLYRFIDDIWLKDIDISSIKTIIEASQDDLNNSNDILDKAKMLQLNCSIFGIVLTLAKCCYFISEFESNRL